ncbi:unnamed protein product [Heligmosomoides polygyrus]|uniref:Occludin_ELL domain-containing protein n=1 Tax=Heligmosomoides polygyrus TaxID=6339 RepID=A0A183GI17_HELPZ|nr:unnamed protein product [Heligmosomoides polygyrus]
MRKTDQFKCRTEAFYVELEKFYKEEVEAFYVELEKFYKDDRTLLTRCRRRLQRQDRATKVAGRTSHRNPRFGVERAR